jgi:hypothetical protein
MHLFDLVRYFSEVNDLATRFLIRRRVSVKWLCEKFEHLRRFY